MQLFIHPLLQASRQDNYIGSLFVHYKAHIDLSYITDVGQHYVYIPSVGRSYDFYFYEEKGTHKTTRVCMWFIIFRIIVTIISISPLLISLRWFLQKWQTCCCRQLLITDSTSSIKWIECCILTICTEAFRHWHSTVHLSTRTRQRCTINGRMKKENSYVYAWNRVTKNQDKWNTKPHRICHIDNNVSFVLPQTQKLE